MHVIRIGTGGGEGRARWSCACSLYYFGLYFISDCTALLRCYVQSAGVGVQVGVGAQVGFGVGFGGLEFTDLLTC